MDTISLWILTITLISLFAAWALIRVRDAQVVDTMQEVVEHLDRAIEAGQPAHASITLFRDYTYYTHKETTYSTNPSL